MKILILEDNLSKIDAIISEIKAFEPEAEIFTSTNQFDFSTQLERNLYDLIIIDLMVPMYANNEPTDLTETIIYKIRDEDCVNFNTQVLALTQYTEAAHKFLDIYSSVGIQIGKYSENAEWKTLLFTNLRLSRPVKKYDFVILCALQKEADAFMEIFPSMTKNISILGLVCRRVEIGDYKGLIVTCSRMGLVNAAITATKAIEYFKPNIICMSGICAGLKPDEINIYDIIISESCYQHDIGKWGSDGFISELYPVHLDPDVRTCINNIITDEQECKDISLNITTSADEFADKNIDPKLAFGITSSGSNVIANDDMVKQIQTTHRKLVSLDMEIYSVYEAARMSSIKPMYFSCKSIVDNGTPSKGDNYHRLACLFAARCTTKILKGLLYEVKDSN